MTFGERLKKARIDSGINQADAAKKLEMSRPTLSAIEADKRQVLASEILQFAELYNVPNLGSIIFHASKYIFHMPKIQL